MPSWLVSCRNRSDWRQSDIIGGLVVTTLKENVHQTLIQRTHRSPEDIDLNLEFYRLVTLISSVLDHLLLVLVEHALYCQYLHSVRMRDIKTHSVCYIVFFVFVLTSVHFAINLLASVACGFLCTWQRYIFSTVSFWNRCNSSVVKDGSAIGHRCLMGKEFSSWPSCINNLIIFLCWVCL
jgi:hypothetical protein